MRDVVFLAINVCGGTAGELCITRAMKHIGEVKNFAPHHLVRVMLRAFRIGWMWLGLSLMSVAFFALLTLLSWENVSFVIPATALNYAVGALGAKFLLGEHISPKRWSGVLLVCLGVALVWFG
jgi:drug/metabolite transporter (DMT)-like permease